MKFTVEQKMRLAQLLLKKNEQIQGLNSTTTAKREAWDSVYHQLVAEGVPIKNVHHLKMVTTTEH